MKSKKLLPTALLLGGSLLVGLASAQPQKNEDRPAPPATSKEFDQLKALVGKWKGTSTHDQDQPMEVSVEYELTAGGSAILERLFPGTPHAMISVYHDQNGKLIMTHYCMLGNQPTMELQNAQPDRMEFSLAPSAAGLRQQPHMHSLKIDFKDPDHVTQAWEMYEDGQSKSVTTFDLTRVK